MAIDDNTSYELTGAQVKDLANKIKAKAADNIFVGATSAIPGSKGLVPAPQAGDEGKFLSGDGTWKTVQSGGATTMLYVSDMGRNPSSVTFYKDEQQTEAASAQFIKDAFDAGKVIIYDDEFYFFAEIVAASEDGYPGTDVTFKLASGWETPSSGTDPEPEIRYIYYSSYSSTTAEVSFVYLTQPFRGATSVYNGAKGYVPAPLIADRDKFLKGDGTWGEPSNVLHLYTSGLTASGFPLTTDTMLTQPITYSDIVSAFMSGKHIIIHDIGGTSPTPPATDIITTSVTSINQTDAHIFIGKFNGSGSTGTPYLSGNGTTWSVVYAR